jgi:hypothetical protein
MKPNFLIIGSPKCGTTSLYKYLSQHPSIELSDRKEPKFFCWNDKDLNFRGNDRVVNQIYATTIQDKQEYLDLFKKKSAAYIGEASVDYFHTKNTAKNISDFNPNMKLIVILRNPAERAYSDWKHNVKMGYENIRSFGKAIKAIEYRKRNNGVPYFDYLIKGNYASHLKEYLVHFEKQKLLILFFEDFKKEPEKTCNQILDFLGETNYYHFQTDRIYTRSGKLFKYYRLNSFAKKMDFWDSRIGDMIRKLNTIPEHISEKDRNYLIKYYEKEIKALEKILDKNLAHWLR